VLFHDDDDGDDPDVVVGPDRQKPGTWTHSLHFLLLIIVIFFLKTQSHSTSPLHHA